MSHNLGVENAALPQRRKILKAFASYIGDVLEAVEVKAPFAISSPLYEVIDCGQPLNAVNYSKRSSESSAK